MTWFRNLLLRYAERWFDRALWVLGFAIVTFAVEDITEKNYQFNIWNEFATVWKQVPSVFTTEVMEGHLTAAISPLIHNVTDRDPNLLWVAISRTLMLGSLVLIAIVVALLAVATILKWFMSTKAFIRRSWNRRRTAAEKAMGDADFADPAEAARQLGGSRR
jgi:hypothetical protein